MNIKYLLLLSTSLWFCTPLNAQDDSYTPRPRAQNAELILPDYTLYDKVLATYVNDKGEVDYEGLRTDTNFKAVLQSIALFHPANNWPREAQVCFWINVYNMHTLKLVCDNPGIKSLKDIERAWDQPIIKLGKKQVYSLNNIEKEILMTRFLDPRVYMVLCNGTKSAPPLYNKAIRPSEMVKVLDQRAAYFINNQTYNTVTPSALKLSKIFEWHQPHFNHYMEFIEWLNVYSKVKIQPKPAIEYNQYDWSLNAQAPARKADEKKPEKKKS